MDLQFYGANCVSLTHKGTRVVVDDNLADLGGKSVLKAEDVALYTGAHGEPDKTARLAFDQPGEYVNVFHHRDYVSRHWSRWFEVLHVIPGYIFTHDLVVLRAR